MANIDSFLSEGFLQEYIERLPRDFFADDFLPNIELYHFLDKHTNIILGGKKEDYSALVKTDGLTRNLIDRYLQGDESVKIEDWSIESLVSYSNIFKFFFLSSFHSLLNSRLNYLGYPTHQLKINHNPSQIIGYEAITITRIKSLSNRLENWKSLKKKILPFHSIIIIDNYLFSKPKVVDATILMMEALLTGCNTATNLTFIYSCDKYKENGNELIHEWIDIKNKIDNSFLKSYTNISVYKFLESNIFHDRMIITNSQLLISGNSFSQFFHPNNRTKLSSPTILSLNSHACKFNQNDWSEISKFMLKTIKSSIVNSKHSEKMLGDTPTSSLLN